MYYIYNLWTMETIAFINHKGGVGKTTSTMNVAARLAEEGYDVLAMDLDPQGNLTQSLGLRKYNKNIYHAFAKDEELPIYGANINLDLVPSNLDFAGVELELSNRIGREQVLEKLLNDVRDDYDYCLIDSPPSLGLITLNILVASNRVYIPILGDYLSMVGIKSMADFIGKVKEYYNKDLSIGGVFFTRYQENQVLTKSVKAELEKQLGAMLMESTIRTNIALSEAQLKGMDIFTYSPTSNGAIDYDNLTKEIIGYGKK